LLTFPFDAYRAAKTIPNCAVLTYQTFARDNGVSLSDVVAGLESDAGCSVFKSGNYLLFYNNCSDVLKPRKIFTIAHEIGHIVLGHHRLDVMEEDKHEMYQHNEREANYFAATLLCPMPMVKVMNPVSYAEIRQMFGLSKECAEIAWRDYIAYDRLFNLAWHNDIKRLFTVNTAHTS
jgi:Zn-dependent peptidase ImmA (M78 family)